MDEKYDANAGQQATQIGGSFRGENYPYPNAGPVRDKTAKEVLTDHIRATEKYLAELLALRDALPDRMEHLADRALVKLFTAGK